MLTSSDDTCVPTRRYLSRFDATDARAVRPYKSLLVLSLLVSLFGNFVDDMKRLKILIGKLHGSAVFTIA